jgi:electron transfer flavoprotein alpha subunit
MDSLNDICIIYVTEPVCNEKHMFQIVTKAHTIANEMNKKVKVLYIGDEDEHFVDELITYGADEVNIRKTDLLDQENELLLSDICYHFIHDEQPEIVLFPATERCIMISSRISSILNTGLVAECIDMNLENTKVIFYRMALNDTLKAKIICTNKILQMATVRQNVFQEIKSREIKDGVIHYLQYHDLKKEEMSHYELVEEIQDEKVQVNNIDDAKIVFGVGRGVKNKETLQRIINIANAVHAEVAGTRPVVQDGLLCYERQVGQSGKSISPNLYIAFGVSGTCQHMVGIRNAKTIIAINHDQNAPIFQYADYIIVDEIDHVIIELDKLVGIKSGM